jgi:hypothetical protein
MPTDEGPVSVGIGSIVASPVGLYYTIYVVQSGAPGLAESYLPGSVMRVPLGGGQPTEVASGYLFNKPVLTTTSVILGEGAVVSAANGSGDAIALVPLSGGPPTTIVTLGNGDSLMTPPATDGTFVYYGDQEGIQAVPLNPDAGSPFTVIDTGLVGLDAVGPLGSRLIFILPQGQVQSVPLPPMPDSAVASLGKCAPGSDDLMACGSSACWLAGTNTIEKLDPLGGAPTTVATLTGAVADAYDIAFDGSNFYVIGTDDADGQSLERIPSDGGCPVVLARMPYGDRPAVSVDDECVYWSNPEGIFSLATTADGPFDQ